MTSNLNHQRIDELLGLALEMAPEEQEQFLQDIAESDGEAMRLEVQQLLDADRLLQADPNFLRPLLGDSVERKETSVDPASPNGQRWRRGLLLAALAVQRRWISQEQLRQFVENWDADTPCAPSDVFREYLAKEQIDALETELAAALDGSEDQGRIEQRLLDSLRGECSDEFPDPLGTRYYNEADGAPRASTNADPRTSDTGRFTFLRFLAKGGLGQVSVARDEQFQREVALKEIQSDFRDDAESRRRFVREAEVTGLLEHPGVAPVYAFGRTADGHPFYAMKLIHGESLKQAIRRFHQDCPPDKPRRLYDLALRRLLDRFVDVCNVMEYAHSRGILHRDLKPSNIMLGKHGETMVVDWGLAGHIASESSDQTTDEQVKIQRSPDAEATRLGTTMGTPPFASPEQVAGRWDQVGPASDVYSLGATLHVLLTNAAPQTSLPTSGEKTANSAAGSHSPPVDGRVPRALREVCRKAMEEKPEARYASCRALADDLQAWMAGEAVSAWREPWSERAQRWIRRNGRLAASVVVVAGLVMALLLINSSRTNRRLERYAELTLSILGEGQRFATLELIAETARIRVTPTLRDLAVMALAKSDLGMAQEIQLRGDIGQGPLRGLRVAFDHKLERYAVAHSDGKIEIYRRSGEQLLATLPACGKPVVYILTFSPDGKHLAARHDGEDEVVIWDWAAKREHSRIPEPVEGAALDFSPDSLEVAIATSQGVAIYPLTGGEPRVRIQLQTTPRAMAYSPDGTRLALTGAHRCFVLNLDSDQIRPQPLNHADMVRGVAWRADGRVLATTCVDRRIYLWDVDGRYRRLDAFPTEDAQIHVAFNHRGDLLATCGRTGDIQLWDVATRESVARGGGTSGSHLNFSTDRLRFSPDDRLLAYGLEYNTLRIWPIASNALVAISGPPGELSAWQVELHPENRLAVTTGDDGLRFWDTRYSAFIGRIALKRSKSATFTPAGSSLLIVDDQGLHQWPVEFQPNGAAIDVRVGPPTQLVRARDLEGVAVDRDGRHAYISHCNEVGTIDQVDLETGTTLRVGAHPWVGMLAVDPLGRWLASGARWGDDVMIWSLPPAAPAAQPIRQMPIRGGAKLVFSPDGEFLAAGSRTQYAICRTRDWSVRRLHRKQTLSVGQGCLDFSPDGKLLALAPSRDRLELFDPSFLEVRAALRAPEVLAGVACRFSPDGSRLAFNALDASKLMIWDVQQVRGELERLGLQGQWPTRGTSAPKAPENPPPLRLKVQRVDALQETQVLAEVQAAVQGEDWATVESCVRQLLEFDATDLTQLANLAVLLRYAQRTADYDRTRTELLRRSRDLHDPATIETVIRASTLREAAVNESLIIERLLGRMMVVDDLEQDYPWFATVHAQAMMQVGDLEHALELNAETLAVPAARDAELHTTARLLRGLLLFRLGRTEQADAPLQSIADAVKRLKPGRDWPKVLAARILLGECLALIEEPSSH